MGARVVMIRWVARCSELVKMSPVSLGSPEAGGGKMTLAEWCVLGALLLYLLTIVSIKWIRFGGFDNSRPRDPAFYEDAISQRALGAHQNGIETFPFFA